MNYPWYSGFQFGLGLAMAFFLVLLVVSWVCPTPRDDSDGPEARSGVKVITDYKTGMQYLKAPGGGITPRMDTDGNQVRESR
jgi:hypothetical protein